MENIITLEDFMHIVRCSKAAYLNKHHPSIADENKRQDVPERDDYVTDILCNTIQPNGIKISKVQELTEKISRTRDIVLDRNKYTLHQGVFLTSDNESAQIVALQKDSTITAWALKPGTEKVYMEDLWPVAYQYYVLHKCGIKVNKFLVATINPKYVKRLDNSEKLFVYTDVTLECKQMQKSVEKFLIRLRKVLKKSEEPFVPIGYQCPKPTCVFYKYCWAEIEEGSVFEFFKMSFPQKFRLYQNNYEKIESVPDSIRLTPSEKIQLDCHKNKKDHVDKDAIQTFVKKCSKSNEISFLDINSTKEIVPDFEGTPPETNLPYQFSFLKDAKGKTQSSTFTLNPRASYDSRLEFIIKLVEALETNKNYPILVWDAKYIKNYFNEIKSWYSDLSAVFDSITKRLISLHSPFQEKSYYNRLLAGRDDLWAVLRVFIPEEEYQDLEIISNREAQIAFYKMKIGSAQEHSQAKKNLSQYSSFKAHALRSIYSQLKSIA